MERDTRPLSCSKKPKTIAVIVDHVHDENTDGCTR
jgi:hypothetical protein